MYLAFVLGCTVFLCVLAHYWIKRSHFGIDQELKNLGSPRVAPRLGKVVICGGGITGVLAARTSLTHFDQVFLVDPEFSRTLAGAPKSRVMQYNSIHLYLWLFVEGLRRLWPSFDQKAQDAGWQLSYSGQPGHYLDGTYIRQLMDALYPVLSMRRSTLETLLHSLLVNEAVDGKSLSIVEGTVRGMVYPNLNINRVSVIHGKHVDETSFEIDNVDLVIDCTGRAQSGINWLEAAGFVAPRRVVYSPHLRYTTITFHVPDPLWTSLPIPEDQRTGAITFLPNADISQRGVVFARMDNETAHLAFFSWGPSDSPRKADDIIPAITSIGFTKPVPKWFIDMVQLIVDHGSPVITPAQLASCTRVEYHRADGLPSNFIAMGDAAATINPIFGQGCAKAMSDIVLLDVLLRQSTSEKLSPTFSTRFFEDQSKRIQPLWRFGKAMDYAYCTTEPTVGETRMNGRALRWLARIFMQAAEMDKQVAHALWLRYHLLASESEVVHPVLLVRIIWANLRRACAL